MLLAVPESAASGQRLQKTLVSVTIERRELEPPLEMTEDLLPRAAFDQPFQHGGMSAAEATTLRSQPGAEMRTAVDLQTLEELAGKQHGQGAQPPGIGGIDALLDRIGDLGGIDAIAGQVECDR